MAARFSHALVGAVPCGRPPRECPVPGRERCPQRSAAPSGAECRGRRPRRPAAPSGAECRLNERSVAPSSRMIPLAKTCFLVMPPAAYFSAGAEKSMQKLLLSVLRKPVPRHVSLLRLRLVPVLRPRITGENYSTRRPMLGGEGTSFYFGLFLACALYVRFLWYGLCRGGILKIFPLLSVFPPCLFAPGLL